MLQDILFRGKSYPCNPDHFVINIGKMFGFLKEKDGQVSVANRIFEMRLYNLFLSEEVMDRPIYQCAMMDKNQFIVDGMLDIDPVMKKISQHFIELYCDSSNSFIEENGRKIFLTYLKPIINGTGNYYIEARTRNLLSFIFNKNKKAGIREMEFQGKRLMEAAV